MVPFRRIRGAGLPVQVQGHGKIASRFLDIRPKRRAILDEDGSSLWAHLDLPSDPRHPASDLRAALEACRAHPCALSLAFARRLLTIKSIDASNKKGNPPLRGELPFLMGPPGLEPGTDGL